MDTFISLIDDIVDIIIVSYVIYKLLILVRGTRAIQLLKGIMVIVVALLISTFFHLKTLQFLMSQALIEKSIGKTGEWRLPFAFN